MNIREINSDDAGAFLKLSQRLDDETSFMLYEPGERTLTIDEQREKLEKMIVADKQMIFVAEDKHELIGFIACFGGTARRNSKCASVVIGLLQQYAGQGIGTALFDKLVAWAKQQELHRLELTVMEHNRPAMMLYDKVGFKIEGTRKQALLVDGDFVNEFYMGKLLEN